MFAFNSAHSSAFAPKLTGTTQLTSQLTAQLQLTLHLRPATRQQRVQPRSHIRGVDIHRVAHARAAHPPTTTATTALRR